MIKVFSIDFMIYFKARASSYFTVKLNINKEERERERNRERAKKVKL